MLFYKFEGTLNKQDTEYYNSRERYESQSRRTELASRFTEFSERIKNEAFFFIWDFKGNKVNIGIITKHSEMLEKHLPCCFRKARTQFASSKLEEVTFKTMWNMLNCASRNDYIEDENYVMRQFGIDELKERHWYHFEENMISKSIDKPALYKKADRFLCSESIVPELDRIYSENSVKKPAGHPVHYIIEADDRDIRQNMLGILTEALYDNKRIDSRRFWTIDIKCERDFCDSFYEQVFKTSDGGTVVIKFFETGDEEDRFASFRQEVICGICEKIKKYRNSALTVLCFPRECSKIKDEFFEHLGNMSFVEMSEDLADSEKSRKFLSMLASDYGVRTDKKLFSKLEADRKYLTPELRCVFDEWYDKKLKTKIYPEYRSISSVKLDEAKKEPKGVSYDDLSEMTGLYDAKKVINQALDYYKAQKLFAERGMKLDRPAMHMVFTGNPGTAKTTVARIFAGIMRENGLLSRGHMVEVGRGDLVGRYVGWTAPTVQRKFKEAEGGVLFIDEAYSLVDDSNTFGDEAINTIVQEMENHRDDMVVIFAGYPDEMERFLEKNPGLRSRIAFHVPFADYSTGELCDIAKLIASKKGLTLSEGAVEKLSRVFETAAAEPDFGNGRYVRNAIEKAKMAQACRLVKMDYDKILDSDITTITAEDIEIPAAKACQKVQIGFGA